MLNHKRIGLAVAAVAVLFSAAFENRALAAFVNGDFITYPQGSWGATPTATNAAGLLLNNYNAVYGSTVGVVDIGIPGAAGFSMLFTNVNSVLNYLPVIGAIGPLTSDFINPSSTMSGSFGANVLALRINIDFSDAGLLPGNLGIPFGDLVLDNFTAQPLLNGLTVRQFSAEVNKLLGGGSGNYPIDQLNQYSSGLNVAFDDGQISPFAQDHLRVVVDMRGDFNQDGTVDAADYVVWRKTLGQTDLDIDPDTCLAADANCDGQINPTDYGIWRGNFGNSAAPSGAGAIAGPASSANAAVPEPTAAALALVALLGLAYRPNLRRNRC